MDIKIIECLNFRQPEDIQASVNEHAIGEKKLDKPIEISFANNSQILKEQTSLLNRESLDSLLSGHNFEFSPNCGIVIPLEVNSNRLPELLIILIYEGAEPPIPIDFEAIKNSMKYVTSSILLSFKYFEEKSLRLETESLLKMTKKIFEQIGDLSCLLKEIMNEAKRIIEAERCSLFLINESRDTLIASVFDGVEITKETKKQIRIPINSGVAGYVATTGKILNIQDAYSFELFYKEIDATTGFKTRNILCFPIKDDQKQVIGVAQLCNKLQGLKFTEQDERVAQIFTGYCYIAIIHSITCKKLKKAQNQNKLANEIMNYHMMMVDDNSISILDGKEIKLENILSDWQSFRSVPRSVSFDKSEEFVMGLCDDLHIHNILQIPRKYLAKFIIMSHLGYRDTPYHNWVHAFTVAHFAYLCIKNFKLIERDHLSQLECACLFLAALCHDIDHRGTTNSFQVKSKSVLASLYSSEGSVLERHHLSQMICIISTENCTLFENFEGNKYTEVLDTLKHIILSTDLAHHFKIYPDLKAMLQTGYHIENKTHRSHLLSILMTGSDLSDQTKGWENAVSVSELIYQEFFRQGDLEKAMGNEIDDSMDRTKACIPMLQINFLDHVVIPCYEIIDQMYLEFKFIMDSVRTNKERWIQKYQDVSNRPSCVI